MRERATRVLIVEDHQVVAEGLAALINDQKDMTVVGQAGSVSESIARAAEVKPDLVLIDFRLTDGTGADAAIGIRQIVVRPVLHQCLRDVRLNGPIIIECKEPQHQYKSRTIPMHLPNSSLTFHAKCRRRHL